VFGVDSIELLIVAVVALLFIGPKELPQMMLKVGRFVGKIRGYARHFTSGIESAMREAELEEMEKKWRSENERIMALHPPDAHYPDPTAPPPELIAPSAPPIEDVNPRPGFAVDDDDPTPPSERDLP
jgi:sec-independent protein translocase protein TatB